jgi:predicted GIY-YIG superfamily endonuclease
VNIAGPNRYQIRVSKTDYRCISVNGKPTGHFITPDTKPGRQKLYVLKNSKEVYYVGVTSLSMSSRLRSGYRAKGEHGYYGYKWIGKISRAELLVWCFTKSHRARAEAIEGELVYLIRNRTGKWPKYQMEIHFHPDASDREKQIAETLANICLE